MGLHLEGGSGQRAVGRHLPNAEAVALPRTRRLYCAQVYCTQCCTPEAVVLRACAPARWRAELCQRARKRGGGCADAQRAYRCSEAAASLSSFSSPIIVCAVLFLMTWV